MDQLLSSNTLQFKEWTFNQTPDGFNCFAENSNTSIGVYHTFSIQVCREEFIVSERTNGIA